MFLKIWQISQENTYIGVCFNKVAGLRACNFVKKKLKHRRYYVKFANFSRTLFFTEHLFIVTASVCSENLNFSPEQLANPMLVGNNFNENFTTEFPVRILQNV